MLENSSSAGLNTEGSSGPLNILPHVFDWDKIKRLLAIFSAGVVVIASLSACDQQETAFHRCVVEQNKVLLLHPNKTCKAMDRYGILAVPKENVIDCKQYEYSQNMNSFQESEDSYLEFSFKTKSGPATAKLTTDHDCTATYAPKVMGDIISRLQTRENEAGQRILKDQPELISENVKFYAPALDEKSTTKGLYVFSDVNGRPLAYYDCDGHTCVSEGQEFLEGYRLSLSFPSVEHDVFLTYVERIKTELKRFFHEQKE